MVIQGTQIKKIKNDIYIFWNNITYIDNANEEWLAMIGKGWWLRVQAHPIWVKYIEWRIGRQSKKFAKELKRKKYKPRQPWDVGIWK